MARRILPDVAINPTEAAPMQGHDSSRSTAAIVDGFDLSFDAGDRRNGSLYLAVPRAGGHAALVEGVAERLRTAGLWSATPCSWVTAQHRPAYREQLLFVDAVRYRHDGVELLAARFDHPKFPSDAARWHGWLGALDAVLPRA